MVTGVGAGPAGVEQAFMDHRLVAWARAVKARQRRQRRTAPPLWLFTDPARTEGLCRLVTLLPRGLCGVVFRHDGVPDRPALARAVVRACRARRIPLTVAGDARLAAALGVGVHLRNGWWPGLAKWGRGLRTSSAHGPPDVRRAVRAGADAVFLSPVWPTRSHADARPLGPVRWAALAKAGRGEPERGGIMALGGVSGRVAGRLPRWCCGAGAIDAFGCAGARPGPLCRQGHSVSQLP